MDTDVVDFADMALRLTEPKSAKSQDPGPRQPMPPASGLYRLGEELAQIRQLIRANRNREAEECITRVLDQHFSAWRCGSRQ